MSASKATTCMMLLVPFGSLMGCAAAPPAKPATSYVRVERDTPPELTPQQRRQNFTKAYDTGMTLAERNDYAQAIGAFQQALCFNPESTEAWIAVGACYESLGDPVEAVTHYRRALNINPDEHDAYANLGTAYIKLFHRDRNPTWKRMALESWRQSLSLNPDQQDIRNYLARVESGGGK